MKVSVVFLIVSLVLGLVATGGIFLHGYLDSIGHWSVNGIIFLNVVVGLFACICMMIGVDAGSKGE
jgi:hypothetical protein